MQDEQQRIEDTQGIWGQKTGFLLFLFLFLATSGGAFAEAIDDQADLSLWDGMEQKSTWHAGGKSNASLSTEYITEGRSSLEISGGNNGGPVVVAKEDTYLDLSYAKKIVFDVYNSGAPCKMAVAVYAGQRYESIPKEIQSGLNRNVTFEFNAKDFTFILTAENVAQTVEFIVYPEGDNLSSLYLDNVRIKQYGSLQSPGIPPTSMGCVFVEGFTPPEITPTYTGSYSVVAFPSHQTYVIPEPATLFLFGAGLLELLIRKKKSLKK